MNGEKLNNFLKVSLIIVNLFLVNVYIIFFSIISMGILTPTIVGAGLYEMKHIVEYDMIGINRRFFTNIKNNLKITLKSTFLLNLFFIILILSFIFFNSSISNTYNPYIYGLILSTQIICLFEVFNITIVSLILIFIFNYKQPTSIIKSSFVIVNLNFVRFLLASISMVINVFLISIYNLFGIIFIALYLLLYYVSVINTVKKSINTIQNS